jgi:transcriptional regulator with XRE-family HTH domain
VTGLNAKYTMPDGKYKPPYPFSVTIGENCARQMRTFQDLAEKLKTPVEDLMRQCNGKTPPSKALVKGLANELGIDEGFLNRLADEVRKDLG